MRSSCFPSSASNWLCSRRVCEQQHRSRKQTTPDQVTLSPLKEKKKNPQTETQHHFIKCNYKYVISPAAKYVLMLTLLKTHGHRKTPESVLLWLSNPWAEIVQHLSEHVILSQSFDPLFNSVYFPQQVQSPSVLLIGIFLMTWSEKTWFVSSNIVRHSGLWVWYEEELHLEIFFQKKKKKKEKVSHFYNNLISTFVFDRKNPLKPLGVCFKLHINDYYEYMCLSSDFWNQKAAASAYARGRIFDQIKPARSQIIADEQDNMSIMADREHKRQCGTEQTTWSRYFFYLCHKMIKHIWMPNPTLIPIKYLPNNNNSKHTAGHSRHMWILEINIRQTTTNAPVTRQIFSRNRVTSASRAFTCKRMYHPPSRASGN